MDNDSTVNEAFVEYYRCPERYSKFDLLGEASPDEGYFRFGPDTICFGRTCSGPRVHTPGDAPYDVSPQVRLERPACLLPFNPTNVINNLRYERYANGASRNQLRIIWETLARNAYYLARPYLPVSVRKHLQRASLRGWDRIPFPKWPVDQTVERILERLLVLSLEALRVDRIPFIWFWPDGHSSCAVMTHDVETSAGLDFCPFLMDVDDSWGIKASFQIVPEERYRISPRIADRIRDRGFEVNIHDLNHDGHLYKDGEEFRRRAQRINRYARQYGAKGFRSGALYRNLGWYDALDFSYDMSVPNVGHLDPQRGGCCTVMPYFVGEILELPLTTTQDYTLFQILEDYSIDLWKRQIELIIRKHGLISFIIHPDYVIEQRAQGTYKALLAYLSQLRMERKIWMALPREVDRWWRDRKQMKLVWKDDAWRIEGPGRERARIAYATLEDDHVSYALEPAF